MFYFGGKIEARRQLTVVSGEMGGSEISRWFVEQKPSISETLLKDSAIDEHKDKSPDGVQTPPVAPMHHEQGGKTAQMVHRRTNNSSTNSRNLLNFDRLVYSARTADISDIHEVAQGSLIGPNHPEISSFQTHLKQEHDSKLHTAIELFRHPEMFCAVLQLCAQVFNTVFKKKVLNLCHDISVIIKQN